MECPVEKLKELCLDHGIVVVSYGLAPRPFGFCIELPDHDLERDTLDEIECTIDRIENSDRLTRKARKYFFP